MSKVRKFLLISIFILNIYMVIGIMYTIYVVKHPLITFPEEVLPLRNEIFTVSMVLVIIIAFTSTMLMLYHEFKGLFTTQGVQLMGFITLYSFFVFEETFLHGNNLVGHSWLYCTYYVDYFGLYKVYIENQFVHFVYETWYMLVFHIALIGGIGLSLWKGRRLYD